ncbi:MAG: hypothetical protein HYV67_02705 [Candidatus Taylorbacteria bacterium]|nr:hypothetical protein [Candidatus Taylorbacteria bacterium]
MKIENSGKFTKQRIVLDAILILGVFVAPLWLVCLAAIVCLFLFDNFYESIFLAIMIDGLYGAPSRFFPIAAIYTVTASVLFIAAVLLKKHLRF